MGTVRHFDWLLALSSKCCEERAVVRLCLCIIECSVDSILTKAFDGMAFEVRCSGTILGVLEAPDTLDTPETSALLCSAMEEVILASSVISNLDIGLEKTINC